MRQEALECLRAGRRLTVLPAGTSGTDISGKGPGHSSARCVCSRALGDAPSGGRPALNRAKASYWHLLSTWSGLCRGTCPQRCAGHGLPGGAAAGCRLQETEQLQGVCRARSILGGLLAARLQLCGHPPHGGAGHHLAVCSCGTGRGRRQQSMLPHSPQTAPHTQPTAHTPALRTQTGHAAQAPAPLLPRHPATEENLISSKSISSCSSSIVLQTREGDGAGRGGRLQLRLKSLRVQRVCLKRAALNTFSLEAPRERQAQGRGSTCVVLTYMC